MRRTTANRRATLAAAAIGLLPVMLCAQDPGDPEWLEREVEKGLGPLHMPEELREPVEKVIVVSGRRVADQEVDGSYGRATPGLVGGMDRGSRMGTISKEVGGVPIYFPIPGTQLPGAILGGIIGLSQREIQEFRDQLTEQLVNSESPPLRSDGLALDAFWEIRRQEPHLESHLFSTNLEIPEDADAVVHTDFDDLAIEIDGREAVITTSVIAKVQFPGDDRKVYETRISYRDRDELGNWTANDNALWLSYQNFARHYLGRAVGEDLFNRIAVDHELLPAASGDTTFRGERAQHLATNALTPTLAWTLEPGEAQGAIADVVETASVAWDIEIFDDRQLVYDAKDLPEPRHRLGYPLEPCATYRWSVRPVYRADDRVRFGEWMRFDHEPQQSNRGKRREKSPEDKASEAREALRARLDFGKGIMGRSASTAQAYVQDFATLEVGCSR